MERSKVENRLVIGVIILMFVFCLVLASTGCKNKVKSLKKDEAIEAIIQDHLVWVIKDVEGNTTSVEHHPNCPNAKHVDNWMPYVIGIDKTKKAMEAYIEDQKKAVEEAKKPANNWDTFGPGFKLK